MAGNSMGAVKRKLGLKGKVKPGEMIARMNSMKSGKKYKFTGGRGSSGSIMKTSLNTLSGGKYSTAGGALAYGVKNIAKGAGQELGYLGNQAVKGTKAFGSLAGNLAKGFVRNATGGDIKAILKNKSKAKKKTKGYQKPKPKGKGIVKALGQKGTTGNFTKIAQAKGKGVAIAALQNKLAKRRGKPIPFNKKPYGK